MASVFMSKVARGTRLPDRYVDASWPGPLHAGSFLVRTVNNGDLQSVFQLAGRLHPLLW